MSLQSTKVLSVVALVVGILCQVSPALAAAFNSAGLPVWAHWVLVVAGIAAQVKILLAPSVSEKVQVESVAKLPQAVARVQDAVDKASLPS